MPAAVQWTMSYPSSVVVSVSVVAGSSTTAAGKSVSCSNRIGATICVAFGMNPNIIGAGVLATATFKISSSAPSSSVPIQVGAVVGSSPVGGAIFGFGQAATLSVALPANTGGTPSAMTANTGTTPQSGAINTAFSNAPAVTVENATNNPVSGVNVTFTAPGGGASGVFSNSTATITVATNGSGVALAPFTANGTAGGPYTVTATSAGLATVNFSLTNAGAPPSAPFLSAPANGAADVTATPTLTWDSAAGATSYDVYFGAGGSPPFVTNTTAMTYSPGTLSKGTSYSWYIVARNASGTGASAIWSFTTQVSPAGLEFYPITPCRLVDTRGTAAGFNGIAPFSGPSIAFGATLTIPVQSAVEAGTNTTPAPCGTIPSTAQAYSLNVTVVPHVVSTDQYPGVVHYISLWPSGVAQPAVSTLNDSQGQILANAAIVPAGTPSGGISIYNAGPATADVILDMNGYFASTATEGFATGLQFFPVSPCRLVDTRGAAAGFNGISPFAGPALLSGATANIAVQSSSEASADTTPAPCGAIPSGAQAYSLNTTLVPLAGALVHYITLWPSGVAQPTVSTLNDQQGEVVANAAIVPAGAPSGGVSVYNQGPATADVILDLNGYFAAPTGLKFYPVSPCRLVDTRGASAGFNGISPFSGPAIAAGATITIPVQSAAEAAANTTPAPCGTIPSSAQAYSLNLTVVPNTVLTDAYPGVVSFVTIWPAGVAQPTVSTLNDQEALIVANAAIVPAGSGSGGISVYNSGPSATHVVIDMNGYFAP